MIKHRPSTVHELIAPLDQCLKEHYPGLSMEARLAFGVQIVLAHEQSTAPSLALHHLGGTTSPN